MTRKILIIIDNNGNKFICTPSELNDKGKYCHRYYDSEYNNMTSEWLDIKIDREYLLNIHAEFMLDKDDHALHYNRGFREIYGLGYFYSVVLYDNTSGYNVWESHIIHKENGIRCTNFDMYSYHLNDPFRYLSDQIEYEVYQSLDLKKILLQEKTPDVFIYGNVVFDNEEEYLNHIRKEKLDYILDDIQYNPEQKVQIVTIPEYDYPANIGQ